MFINVPLLVLDLTYSHIGHALMRLFSKGSNAHLTAALDAYDRDSDMSILVETLTHISAM